MALNDKLLTLATGAVLAIGGASASLFFGAEEEQGTFDASLPVVAALKIPAAPAETAFDLKPNLIYYQFLIKANSDVEVSREVICTLKVLWTWGTVISQTDL